MRRGSRHVKEAGALVSPSSLRHEVPFGREAVARCSARIVTTEGPDVAGLPASSDRPTDRVVGGIPAARPDGKSDVPLTERLLRRLPGPRPVWVVAWSLIAPLRPVVLLVVLGLTGEAARIKDFVPIFVEPGHLRVGQPRPAVGQPSARRSRRRAHPGAREPFAVRIRSTSVRAPREPRRASGPDRSPGRDRHDQHRDRVRDPRGVDRRAVGHA